MVSGCGTFRCIQKHFSTLETCTIQLLSQLPLTPRKYLDRHVYLTQNSLYISIMMMIIIRILIIIIIIIINLIRTQYNESGWRFAERR